MGLCLDTNISKCRSEVNEAALSFYAARLFAVLAEAFASDYARGSTLAEIVTSTLNR